MKVKKPAEIEKQHSVKQNEVKPEESGRRLVYFAAERTLMAWIHAAVGIMALGFVIDRFGIVVRNVLPGLGPHVYSKALSFWAGTVLVIIGVMMVVVAATRYTIFAVHYHRDGNTEPGPGLLSGIIVALTIAAVGSLIIVYLLSFTG